MVGPAAQAHFGPEAPEAPAWSRGGDAASGEAQLGEPREGIRGALRQGFLEGSNVDPVVELVNLIKTQRAFELNSQSIQAADEVLQTVGQLRRF